jgi:tetratricopeptide (TPR) repeat protein
MPIRIPLIRPISFLKPCVLLILLLASSSNSAVSEDTGTSSSLASLQHHLEAAKQAERAKDYARAAQEYKQIISLRPQAAEAYQNLGLAYHLQNKFQEAIPVFERALTLQPNLWGSSLFLGIAYYKTNQFAKALPELQKALDLNPREAELEARFWLGVSYLAMRQYPAAIRELETRLQRSPNDMEVLYNLLHAHSQYADELLSPTPINDAKSASFEEDPARVQADLAARILQRMRGIDANSYRVHQLEGEQFEKHEQYPKALEAYRAAFDLKPDLPGVRFYLGNVYWKTRQFEEATHWLGQELKINPHHAMAHYQLGNILVYRNKPSEAIPHLQESLAAQPGFMDAHRDLGKAFVQLKEYEKALEHFKRIAEAEPEDDAIHFLLANVYRKQGRTEEEKSEQNLFQELNRKKLERAQQRVQQIP